MKRHLPALLALTLWLAALSLGACAGTAEPEPPAETAAEEAAEQPAEEGEPAAEAEEEAEPEPPEPTPEERLAEARQARAEADRRLSELADDPDTSAEEWDRALWAAVEAEQRVRDLEAAIGEGEAAPGDADVPAAFGTVGPPLRVGPGAQPPSAPFDQAEPPAEEAPTLRLAVLSADGAAEQANSVAVMLGQARREALEAELGSELKLIYVSQTEEQVTRGSLIRFRPGNLQAALRVAAAMPAEQRVEPMTEAEQLQAGVDVLIYVGPAYQ